MESQEYSNIVVNILPADPHTWPLGQKVEIQLFSEHGHVSYQIKWNQ